MARGRLNKAECSIDGCERPVEAKGLCPAHYTRAMKNGGDPLAQVPLGTRRGFPLKFIQETAMQYTGDQCLIWPYFRTKKGYGRVRVDGKNEYAHREVCLRRHGPPPTPEHESGHTCGNGHLGCVNQMHLVWKTPTQNQEDRVLHGTSNRGERHNMVTLTESCVRRIRVLLAEGRLQQKVIAEMFGVSAATITDIKTEKSWSWLK